MKFLKHNLTTLVLVSVLVISIFTLFFAASISYKQIRRRTESEQQVVNSYRIYVELEHLISYAKDAESSQRGFLISKDSAFIHSYNNALERINESFLSLRLLTRERIRQSMSLDTLVFLINQRMSYLNHVLNRSDFIITSPDSINEVLVKGRNIMIQTQGQIDKMVNTELQLLERRESDHANEINFPPFSILFIFLFSLSVFIASFYKIKNDLKGIANTNNQLLINNEIFKHSEQIAGISYWFWDIKENKLSFSNNLYRLLGCRPNEFEPTFENFLEYIHPDDRSILIEATRRTQKDLLPTMANFRIIRKDGIVRYFKSIGKVITDN